MVESIYDPLPFFTTKKKLKPVLLTSINVQKTFEPKSFQYFEIKVIYTILFSFRSRVLMEMYFYCRNIYKLTCSKETIVMSRDETNATEKCIIHTVQQVRKAVQAVRFRFRGVCSKFLSQFQRNIEKHLQNFQIPKPFLHNPDDATDMQLMG